MGRRARRTPRRLLGTRSLSRKRRPGSMIGGGDPATLAVTTVGSMIGSGDPATFAIATVGSTVGLSPAFDYLPPAASGAEEAAGAGSLEEAAGEGSLPHGLSELRAKLRRQLQEKIEASTSPVLDVESHYSQRFQSRLQWLEQAEVAVGRLVLEIEPMPSLPIPIALDPPSEATATIIGGVKLRRTASFLRRVSLSTLSHAPSLGFWAAPASLVAAPASLAAAPASLTAAPAAASVKEADVEEASVHAASSKGGSAAGNGSGAGGATGSSLQLDLFVLRSKLQRELLELWICRRHAHVVRVGDRHGDANERLEVPVTRNRLGTRGRLRRRRLRERLHKREQDT